ncbi:polysaccharide deacetylase family protein [Actinomadura fibrosa]|uniref:Polysaccharide deacetylase family protein n=1 Tax=Actinomadura fibrosa TaxID=111802 RepID=A0ABW2XGX2_9ACTN|nr:polysaccharide deacetylase family protein [Actinomadura fibrosa]
MNPRTRGAAAAAALVLLAPAACAVHTERRTRPIADVTTVRTVDPAALPGTTAVTHIEQDATRRVFASYPRIPGAGALTARLAKAVAAEVRPFGAGADGAEPLPGGGVPELNVQWSLTAATSRVVGVRLVTWRYFGTSGGESRATYWYDAATRTAHPSADLVDGPAGLATLAERVRERLGSRANPAQVRAAADTFPSLAFNEAGDLVAEFSDYTVAPGSAGRVAVALDRDAADPLLSAFGRRARDAALDARPHPASSQAPPPPAKAGTPRTDCGRAKCIALTFDDGPGPGTRRLLSTLSAHGARATFFVVGENAAADPALLREAVAAGNEIGNHTQGHRDLTRMPAMQVNTDVQRTQDVLRAALGRCTTLLRPPYGATNSTVAGVAKSLGLTEVLWNADPADWRERDPAAVAARTIAFARPGAILVLHDTHEPTIEAMPEVLRRLTRAGYTFVTVTNLMATRKPPQGSPFSGL